MPTREILCIVCPNGCRLTVTEDMTVSGNLCPKGYDFAINEVKNPTRSLTTTVKTAYQSVPVLPVRTSGEIRKSMIGDAMKTLGHIVIDRPVQCGDIILEDILGSGIDIIATSDLLSFEKEALS